MDKNLKRATKESLYVIIALLSMCIIIVFTTFVNAGLDPAKIFTRENAGNALINAAIAIFGLVSTIPAGMVDTKSRLNPDGTPGRYIQVFNAYNNIRQKVEARRLEFSQWHIAQHSKEQYLKCVNYLHSKGIFQADDVMKLSKEQICELTTSRSFIVEGREIYYKALTDYQIAAAVKVVSGKLIVHKLSDYYFLHIEGKSTKSFYDQAYRETMSENATIAAKIFYRVAIGFVIACIFTGFVIYDSDPEESTVRAVLLAVTNVITRLFNAFTSSICGWMIGQEIVYRRCYYIEGRTQFLKLFDSDVDFKALTVEEWARSEYESMKGDSDVRNIEKTNDILDPNV